MSGYEANNAGKYIKYAMIFLVILLLLLGILLGRAYIALRRAQIVSANETALSGFLKSHGPLTAANVGIIRPWMTFDYINRIFRVPPDYLQSQLMITDPHYPLISLSGYAKYTDTQTPMVISQVETALYNYLTASSTPN